MDVKMIPSICLYIGLTILFSVPCECSKILVISNIPSVSHSLWYNKLVNLMLNKGHEVVFLDVDTKKINHQNLTHYHMEGAYDYFNDFMAAIASGAIPMESVVEDYSVMGNIDFITSPEVLGCRKLLLGKGFQTFLKDYKDHNFDLLIFDVGCEAYFGLASYYPGVPYIVASAYSDPFTILDQSAAVYDNPAYVPSSFTLFQPKMNFVERLYNCFYKMYFMYNLHVSLLPNQQALAEEVFGKSVGNLDELVSNVALVMYTYHIALFEAKPLPQSVIPLAGLHIDPPKPLPQDVKKFMDDAKDGVIYFSMGSNLKSVIMSPKNINMFLDVFRELPQRVVWKLEIEDTSNVPPNVFVSKWLPQNDILGHPNVKCFISHGGLLGIQEAIHHGVPVLGMPIIFDQMATIERLEKDGAAVHLSYPKLSKAYVKDRLNLILSDKRYMMNMMEKSRIFRDDPQTPREKAIYWIEYVLRHPTELHYLKSSSVDLSWHQRLLLDIVAAVVLPIFAVFYLLLKLMTCIKSYVCSKKVKSKHE